MLGLSHPDTDATVNFYHAGLAAGGRMDNATCQFPWDGVVAGVPGGVAVDETGVRPSVMKAFTQHTPRVCLEQVYDIRMQQYVTVCP